MNTINMIAALSWDDFREVLGNDLGSHWRIVFYPATGLPSDRSARRRSNPASRHRGIQHGIPHAGNLQTQETLENHRPARHSNVCPAGQLCTDL